MRYLTTLVLVLVLLDNAKPTPVRHLRIVGLEFGQQEPMIRYTGETRTDIAGDKAAMFETFTPIRLGLLAMDKESSGALTKGAVLYCKQRDQSETAKDATGEDIRIHQEVLDCHE